MNSLWSQSLSIFPHYSLSRVKIEGYGPPILSLEISALSGYLIRNFPYVGVFMKTAIFRIALPAIVAATCIVGCSRPNNSPRPTIDPAVEEQLRSPITCETARVDIATLENAKASVAKQVISGVRAINPFSAAAGVVLGDERDRLDVASGDYNDRIDAKIAAIKRRCVAELGGA